jgi:hypothetical protein
LPVEGSRIARTVEPQSLTRLEPRDRRVTDVVAAGDLDQGFAGITASYSGVSFAGRRCRRHVSDPGNRCSRRLLSGARIVHRAYGTDGGSSGGSAL